MKIILSRKGFDSSTAGIASPILPDSFLLSLPIPRKDSTFTYNDLSSEGKSLGSVVQDLSKGRKRSFSGYDIAHVDPDLDRERIKNRPEGWRPIFGQHKGDQTHLKKQGVGQGDLFLFFGWFHKTNYDVNGILTFLPDSPDVHVIFGWLQIGKVYSISETTICELPDWALYHPHVAKRGMYKPNNTIYIAKENLILEEREVINRDGLAVSGGGVFHRFHPMLQLTWPGYSRSYWKLPHWFYPFNPHESRKPLSYHGKRIDRWKLEGDHVLLETVARGQEFVLDTKDYPEAIDWIKAIFKAAPIKTNKS
ncbi:MAG: hypothetical protein Q8M54_04680 [Desulfobaccales bacterium]|nr:hypothetical protein [Desulfobaccales bacterium]